MLTWGREGALFVSKCREMLEYVMSITAMLVSLQADIMDINEIFKDLGMMIHEQGDVIGKSNENFLFCFSGEQRCRTSFCWKNSSNANINARANHLQLNNGYSG